MTPRRQALLGLSAALTVAFLLRQWQGYDGDAYVDLRVYRAGAQAWLDSGSAYAGDLVPEGLRFTYPPFALVVLAPLAAVPGWLAAACLVALDTALVLGILVVALHAAPGRHKGAPRADRLDALVLLGPVLWLEPVRNTVDYGQINLVLLALVLVDALVVPPRWRGIGMGVAAAVKVVPAFYGLYWLLTGQWRPAARMVAGAVGATGLAAVLMPRDSWRYWTHTLFETERVGALWYTSNQSLRGACVRLVGADGSTATALWMLSVMGVLALTVVAVRRHAGTGPGETSGKRTQGLVALTCVGLAGLLVAPISWSHHWVWFVPTAVVLGVAAVGVPRRPVAAALLATLAVGYVAVCYLAPHWLLPHELDRELDWTPAQWLAGSAYPLLALVVLAALALPTASSRLGAAHSATTSRPSGSM